jgi:hypothetical protein
VWGSLENLLAELQEREHREFFRYAEGLRSIVDVGDGP